MNVSIYYREWGWIYGFIQSSIAYYTPVESFPHILLEMSGPGSVFFKISLLLCTIKYFISLNRIEFKSFLSESMLFNFFLKIRVGL